MITTDKTKTTIYWTVDSPIGELLMTGDGERLQRLHMQGGRRPTRVGAGWVRDSEPFADLCEQLDQYFAGERREFDLDLDPQRLGVRAARLAGAAPDPLRARPSPTARSPSGSATRAGARGRRGERPQPDRGRDPMPPGDRRRRQPDRLRGRAGAKAPAARPRGAAGAARPELAVDPVSRTTR